MSNLYNISLRSGGSLMIEEYSKNEAIGATAKRQYQWLIKEGHVVYDTAEEALREEGYIDPDQTPVNVHYVGGDNTPIENKGITHASYRAIPGPYLELHSYRWHMTGFTFTLNIRTDAYRHSYKYRGAKARYGKVGWDPDDLDARLEKQHSEGKRYDNADDLPQAKWMGHPRERHPYWDESEGPREDLVSRVKQYVRDLVRWGNNTPISRG